MFGCIWGHSLRHDYEIRKTVNASGLEQAMLGFAPVTIVVDGTCRKCGAKFESDHKVYGVAAFHIRELRKQLENVSAPTKKKESK